MYDILQLNDMLVPELLDIAEDLKIENAKKLDKQGLIYKILDKQAVAGGGQKPNNTEDRSKRKRIVKASTANSTEEAIVEESETVAENKRPTKKAHPKKEEKPRKGKKKADEVEIIQTWTDYYVGAIDAMRDIEVGGSSAQTVLTIDNAKSRVHAAGAARIAKL